MLLNLNIFGAKQMSKIISSSKKWEPEIDRSKGIESPIEILNDDVFVAILSLLNFADRIRIERVSLKWHQLSQQSWSHVDKFDFSYETWGILPIDDEYEDNYDFEEFSEYRFDEPRDFVDTLNAHFCVKAIKKVLALCANSVTLTHCDFSVNNNELKRINRQVLIELPRRTLAKFFKSCRNLKWVKIAYDNWVDFPILSLIYLRTGILEELHINFFSEDDVEIEFFREVLEMILKKSPRLHTINMYTENMALDPDDLDMIVDKDAFKSLIFSSTMTFHNTELIESLSEFKNLECCEVGEQVEMTDDVLEILIEDCKKLKTILLECTQVTDRGFLKLKSLPDLEVLKLYNCEYISDINLHHFPNLKCLECYLAPTIKDEGVIKLLNSSQSLGKLMLIKTGVTINCLKAANEAVKKRTNGLPLEIIVNNDLSHPDLGIISPLLKIVEGKEPH